MASKSLDPALSHHIAQVDSIDEHMPNDSSQKLSETADEQEQPVSQTQEITVIQALALEEAAPVRTKLRIGAILLALYVHLSDISIENIVTSAYNF